MWNGHGDVKLAKVFAGAQWWFANHWHFSHI
jgi:hypothetical protein